MEGTLGSAERRWHPISPLLAAYPIALLGTSLVLDATYFLYGDVSLASGSFWCITAGLVGGLVAAVVGAVAWLGWRSDAQVREAGMWMAGGNALAVLLFGISWLIRWYDLVHAPTVVALLLSAIGAIVVFFAGRVVSSRMSRRNASGVGTDTTAADTGPASLPAYRTRRAA